MSSKRVAVNMDEGLHKKICQIQARMIQKRNKSVSYFEVINIILKDELNNS